MAWKIKKSFILKGMLVFILLSVGVMVGILIWTTKRETWSQLVNFQWQFIPPLIAFSILRWYFDGMSFVTMAKYGSKSNLRLNRAAAIRLEGHLIAHIIPVLIGTFTMHAYLLHKEKLKISEAFALTVLRAILPIFFFLLNIPILMFMEIDADSGKFFAEFLKIISLPVAIIIIFLVITLFYPHTIKRSASKFVWWWGRIKFLHMERILHIEERLFHEIDQFSNILWTYLKEKKLMLLSASGWIFLAFLIDYFIALSIMWGFGFHPPVIRVLLLQFLMRPLLFFAPTPGGTGIWDFTYLGFFSMFMPPYLIGVGVLVWRLMMTYLPAMVGTFILTKDIRSDEKMRKLILEKGELPHEIEEIERKLE